MEERKFAGVFHLSLRRKGILAFIALFSYVLIVAFAIAKQREILGATVTELQSVHEVEERLAGVNTSLAHAILDVNEATTSGSRARLGPIALDIEAIEAGLRRLQPSLPILGESIERLELSMAMVQSIPLASSLFDLREGLHVVVGQMDAATQQTRKRRTALSAEYRRVYDNVTRTGLAMGSIGFVLFGGLVTLFFTRLSSDLRTLRERAVDVVKGYRGQPLPVTRHDEVGSLMQAVNRMQQELRERESQLEISRRRAFHEEKMAAVGSLAAAVAHEINNPIAAIAGIAESIDTRCSANECPLHSVTCQPHLILEHTRRIAVITRQLSELTTASSPDPGPLDLNELVRSTCSFLGYDKRLRKLELAVDLDPQLPAVHAVSDHVIQILMNLLINAADALENTAAGSCRILVSTCAGTDAAILTVADNGCGMDASTLARAFDEAYTTKPSGKGSGIGLFMCRTLVQEMGGDIALESEQGKGTRALVHLPLFKAD